MVRGRGPNVVDRRDSWRVDPGTDDSAPVPRGHHDLWGLGWPLHISCSGIVPVWGGCRIFQERFHRNLRELDFAARGFVKSAPFD